MNPADRKKKLQEDLGKAMALDNIYKSADFQSVLLPALKTLATVQVIDPKNFPSRDEFARAAEMAFNTATTYQELIKYLSSQEQVMKKIRDQINTPEKNWSQ